MKLQQKIGSTSVFDYVFIQDSTATDGSGLTGLVFNTAGLTAFYTRKGAASVAITLITQTVTGAYSSGGFVEVDAVNCPGLYRIDYPDAMLADGAENVVLYLQGVADMVANVTQIQLTEFDFDDVVRGGLTALPDAIQTTVNGIPVKTDLSSPTDLWAATTRTLTAGTKDAEIDSIKAVTDVIPDSGAMTSIAQEATLAATDLVVDSIKVDTGRVDALIEDSVGDQFTAKALSQAPSGGGGGDATLANQTQILADLAATDVVVDSIKVDTSRVDGLIEDVTGDRFTAKALEEAPDTGGDVNVIEVGGVAVSSPDDFKADVSGLSSQTSVDAIGVIVTAIENDTSVDIPALIAALNDISSADVKAQIVEAFTVDTYAEPGKEIPAATNTLATKIGYLFKSWRNKKDGDGSQEQLYDAAGTTVDQERSVTADGDTVTKGDMTIGS